MLLRPSLREPCGREARRTAFTLLEVLIVVAIIVVLAGASAAFYFKALDDAKEGVAKTKARVLADQCQQFMVKNDRYPESLNELLSPPDGGRPYVEPDALNDPWGTPFQYNPAGPNNNGLKPDVYTINPTTGQTIGNWTTKPGS